MESLAANTQPTARRLAIFVVVLAWLALLPNAHAELPAIATDGTSATATDRISALADAISASGAVDTGTTSDVAATTTGTISGKIDNAAAPDSDGTASSKPTAAAPVSSPIDPTTIFPGSGKKPATSDATDTIETQVGGPSGSADAGTGPPGAIDNTTVIAPDPTGQRSARPGRRVGDGRLNRQRGRAVHAGTPPVAQPGGPKTDPLDQVIVPAVETPAAGTAPAPDAVDTGPAPSQPVGTGPAPSQPQPVAAGTAPSQPVTAPPTATVDSATAPVAEAVGTGTAPLAPMTTPAPIVALHHAPLSFAPSAPASSPASELALAARAPRADRAALLAAGASASLPAAAGISAPALLSRSVVAPRRGARSGGAAVDAGQPAPGGLGGLSSAGAGSSSGGGFSPSLFLAILFALAGLAGLLCERLRLPAVIWRPVAFVSLLERPG